MGPRDDRIEIRDNDCRQGYSERIKTMLNKRETKYRLMWHKIFLLCGVVSVSLDSLFFYVPIINDKEKCLGMDEKLKKTVLVLRSVIDLTYIFHIAFQILYGYLAFASELPKIDKVIDNIKGVIRKIKWWIIIIDIMCVLPMPQVVILVYFFKMKDSKSMNVRRCLNFFVIFQYVPKLFQIYRSYKKLTKNLSPHDIAGAKWVKGLLNFFLYVIASHLYGAIWYIFSIQRESECWQQACKGNSICNQSTFLCKHRYDIVNDPIIGYLNLSCPLIPPYRFDFGMFTPALQSKIVNSMDFLRKFFYCFAWGLRNLSSFGSNLQTSTNFWESLFSAGIAFNGLLLFIYLIGNFQTYLQSYAKDSEKIRRKMKTKGLEIDMWIKGNEIPPDMRKELMDCVRRKMHENEDVNLKNILNVLPTQSKKRIKQCLCLPILKNVPRLQHMSDEPINEIIDHLKPVIFYEHNKIFREGEPLSQMIFFTQGSAWAYTTPPTTHVELKRGDFYGEELFEWALTAPSTQIPNSKAEYWALSASFAVSSVPVSTKRVITHTKAEAFVLRARDLKILVTKFWWLFSRDLRNCPEFRQNWDSYAAFTLQSAWRQYRRNKVRKDKESEGSSSLSPGVKRSRLMGQFMGDLRQIGMRKDNKDQSESSRV